MHRVISIFSVLFVFFVISCKPVHNDCAYQILPVGSIKTSGWIQKQMEEDALFGWANTVQEMSLRGEWIKIERKDSVEWGTEDFGKNPFYQPYITKEGHPPIGGEYQAHWLDMMIRFAFAANVPGFREKVTLIVNSIVEHANENGYLGPMRVDGNPLKGEDVFIMWGYGETLNALIQYYKYTREEKVLKALEKAADQIVQISEGEMTSILANQDWYTSICTFFADLYMVTDNKTYLDFAELALYHYIGSDNNFNMVTGGLTGMIEQNQELLGRHTAGIGIFITSMLRVYKANGDPEILRWINYALNKLGEKSIQPHGAPTGELEMLTETGPYVNTELCDVFWWSCFWTDMFEFTGDTKYLDLAEKAAYNALPGQRSKDAKTMSYFASPNQLVAIAKGNFTFQTHYPSRLYIECCQSNGPRLLPYLAERMVMKNGQNLAFAYYFSGEVSYSLNETQKIILQTETDYPFDERIKIKVVHSDGGVPVKLSFRVPQWCESPQLFINHEKAKADKDGNWMHIEKSWEKDDSVELVFPMDIKVTFWKEQSCYVERGPVLFTLPVNGIRRNMDVWGGFEEIRDTNSVWNYCIVLDKIDPGSSFSLKIHEMNENGLSWEKPRVSLLADAFILDEWKYEEKDYWNAYRASPYIPLLPDQFYEGIKRAGYGRFAEPQTEKVELVPYGNTTLRMTYLPWIYKPVVAEFNKVH